MSADQHDDEHHHEVSCIVFNLGMCNIYAIKKIIDRKQKVDDSINNLATGYIGCL
jgi:hypothetical protein